MVTWIARYNARISLPVENFLMHILDYKNAFFGILIAVFLAGCGQKGSLYLPDQEPRPQNLSVEN